ncbi:MAG TPA: FHA domain-containing serine/threonine-protein kinase [Chthoniobacter sp.]|nr:FHA domain-containing serine/threonine-protein kinase [Chthoniobacter sp.]
MSLPETHLTILRKDATTEVRAFYPGAYVIGRGAEADIRIETPLISRAHARLTIQERECLIEDLGSSNGTFVEGERIEVATVLRSDESVMLGPSVTLHIRQLPVPAGGSLSLGSRRDALRKLLPPEFLREKKYELGNVIGQGGMGAILNAREVTIQRDVAMKVMLDTEKSDELVRFIAEAKITGQLEHPNIVPVHELGVDDKEQVYYTMKYVRGTTLRNVLDDLFTDQPEVVKKYPLPQLLTIFQKVCDAVAFAHSKGVIHRDLKPENCMLGDYGEVLVMDWGLAKVLDPTAHHAVNDEGHSVIRTGVREELLEAEKLSGTVYGTPQYMAPEQAYGHHDELDFRTDVYALGAILHHVLTLRPPIEGETPREILTKVAAGVFEPARNATRYHRRLPHLPHGKVPDPLSAVAQKAMAQNAIDRYQTVRDFQADIEAYQAGFATTAENAGRVKQAVLLLKRQRYIVGGLIVLIAVLTLFAFQLIRQQRTTAQTLRHLHAAAPALAEQTRNFLAHGQTHEAVEEAAYIIDLAPENAEYARLQGDALAADQQFSSAVAAYKRALVLKPDDTFAQDSLALVEKIRASHPDGVLTKASFQELATLAQQQHRPEAGIFRTLAATAVR